MNFCLIGLCINDSQSKERNDLWTVLFAIAVIVLPWQVFSSILPARAVNTSLCLYYISLARPIQFHAVYLTHTSVLINFLQYRHLTVGLIILLWEIAIYKWATANKVRLTPRKLSIFSIKSLQYARRTLHSAFHPGLNPLGAVPTHTPAPMHRRPWPV